MNFHVEMLAFGRPEEIRIVEVPNDKITEDTNRNLEMVFEFGQNEFQPQNHPSVSVGDVIQYNDEKYLVKNIGFKKLTETEYQNYKNINQKDRFLESLKS